MSVSLTTLILRCRQRADMESDDFIEDAELTRLINESYNELHEEIAQHDPDWFVVGTSDFVLAGGTEAASRYGLSTEADFLLSIRSVEKDPDTANRRQVARFNRRNPPGTAMTSVGADARYRLEGQYIVFEPYESAAGNYRLRWVRRPTLFTAGADTMDTRVERWGEYVIIRTAIKMRDKEESDTSSLWNEFDRLKIRVVVWACKRDQQSPRIVPEPEW